MDDLLALMEDNSAKEESETQESRREEAPEPASATDCFADAFGSSSLDQKQQKATGSSVKPSYSATPRQQQQLAEASVDNKIGIRMSKRKLGSMDLLDLISTNPYHSPASLAAMSRAAWNRLLVEPAAVVNADSVKGKTMIATVGIVLSNSGTRISSSGRAFSILGVGGGNLATGSVVTVFLFGHAYSHHTTNCPPGTVVAVLQPSLVPPRPGSDTAVSLSVNDTKQLVQVANARDYGTCKAENFKGGKCKNYIDTRAGPYCKQHRKMANVKSAAVNKAKGATFVQQLRNERPQQSLQGKGIMKMKTPQGAIVTHVPSGASKPALTAARHMVRQGRDAIVAGSRSEPSVINSFSHSNSVFNRQGNNSGRANPFLEPNTAVRTTTNAGRQQGSTKNPYLQPNNFVAAGRSAHYSQPQTENAYLKASKKASVPKESKSRPLQNLLSKSKNKVARLNAAAPTTAAPKDWLQQASTKKVPKLSNLTRITCTEKKKKRRVNTDCLNFDGAVSVPKPNKLFRTKAPLQAASTCIPQEAEAKRVAILEQQRRLAAQLGTEGSTATQSAKARKETSQDSALKDSLFGKFANVDTNSVLSAKSRFAKEVDAEEYAKSRNAVTELERREAQKEAKTKKSSNMNGDTAIGKEWICSTCHRTTRMRPSLCFRANHKVRLNRTIKTAASTTEKRLQRGDKSAEQGRLTLGKGIEWSTWPK